MLKIFSELMNHFHMIIHLGDKAVSRPLIKSPRNCCLVDGTWLHSIKFQQTSDILFGFLQRSAFHHVWPISQSTFKRREIIKTLLENKSTPVTEHPPLSSGAISPAGMNWAILYWLQYFYLHSQKRKFTHFNGEKSAQCNAWFMRTSCKIIIYLYFL